MKDKNGKEIQHGDFLRIKFMMYEGKEQYDGIYKVFLDGWEGCKLSLVEIFEPEETFHTSLTWMRKDLCFDYKNSKTNRDYYQFLAIDDKKEQGVGIRAWDHIRSYSNDIEIIEGYEVKIP